MVEGKYAPLSAHLIDLDGNLWRATFAEVEAVLGIPLPESALKYPAWWANNRQGSRHAAAWLDAGWQTEELDLATQHIVFRRVAAATKVMAPTKSRPKPVIPSGQPAGDLQCHVEMKWVSIGSVSIDAGKLVFPKVRTHPAIYRINIRFPDDRRARYVGETTNLSRRFGNYRNPGLTQTTSIRINEKLLTAIQEDALVEVGAVVENPWIEDRHGRRQVVLSSASLRRMLENITILIDGGVDIETLNLTN